MDIEKFNFIVNQFFVDSKVLKIELINSGNINKTYIVEYLCNSKKSKFILQRLSDIFNSHETVNMNHKFIIDHMNKKINNNDLDFTRWELPKLIKCKSNNQFVFPFESSFWRAMAYIDESYSIEFLEDEKTAYETGIGLAKFHLFCSNFDSSKLEDSIKNFHDIEFYINKYTDSINQFDYETFDNKVNIRIRSLTLRISNLIPYIYSLFFSMKEKLVDHNVIHGDPKLSNFLFDIKHKYVVSIIDLDTVSKGFLLTDVADCIRSISNVAGEDPKNIENVCFDIKTCMSFLEGYSFISNVKENHSFKFLLEFIYLIIFELTIRFLTDFLQSNSYFKVKYETHNLFRAEVQYRLLSSFLTQIPNLKDELNKIGISSSSSFISDVQKFV